MINLRNLFHSKPKNPTRNALFLDVDGILWPNEGTVRLYKRPKISLEIQNHLKDLNEYFDYVFLVTNQTVLARGEMSFIKFWIRLHTRILYLLIKYNFKAIAICPHHPKSTIPRYSTLCACRKPKSGMIESLVLKYNLDISNSYFIGDKITDIWATYSLANLRAVLLNNSESFLINEMEQTYSPPTSVTFRVIRDLNDFKSSLMRELECDDSVMTFQTLILAGGIGSRMHPLTNKIPKPLVAFFDETILSRLCRQLKQAEVQNINVNVSHLPNTFLSLVLKDYEIFRDVNFIYEPKLLGSGGTLRNFVNNAQNLLVIHGDLVLNQKGISKIVEWAWKSSESFMACHSRESELARSRVLVSGEYIIDFMEGHQLSNSEESVLVNSGVYFLTFSDLHDNEKLCVGNIVENLIPSLAKSGLLKYKVCDFPRFAVESLETLRYAREHSDPELN